MTLDHVARILLVTDTAMVVLIWLVQLIIYPAFRHIDSAQFKGWHRRYVQTIAWIVVPLMVVQLSSQSLLCFSQPTPASWVALGTILAAWGVTFTLSVPCHNQLQQDGNTPHGVNRLIRTNWLRTLCWSLAFLIQQQ